MAPIKVDLRLGIECHLEFVELQRHIRAFDLKGQSIKGYLLSRLKEGRSVRPSTALSGADAGWHERVAMEIGILPGFSRTQERSMDLSRFCAAPLITYCAAKGMNHGHRQDG